MSLNSRQIRTLLFAANISPESVLSVALQYIPLDLNKIGVNLGRGFMAENRTPQCIMPNSSLSSLSDKILLSDLFIVQKREKRRKAFKIQKTVLVAQASVEQSTIRENENKSASWGAIEITCRKDSIDQSWGSLKARWSYLHGRAQTYLPVRKTALSTNFSGEISANQPDHKIDLYRQNTGVRNIEAKLIEGPEFKFIDAVLYLSGVPKV